MRARHKDSLTHVILTILEKSIDGYVRFEDFIYNPGFYTYSSGRELKKSYLALAVKRLKETGFVEKIQMGNEIILKLTSEAKDLVGFEEDEWDGKWRIVIFDIPEQKRAVRNLFRRNLKKWGFKYLQKSVWVSKRKVYAKLVSYVNDLGIGKWVTVIEADKLSNVN